MAQRGPKPLPTQVKLGTGTARAHRLDAHEPRPETDMPEAPDHLDEDGRSECDRVAADLSALGILTRLDRGALAAWCQAWGRWRRAERALARMAERDATTGGLMIWTKSGNLIQNPLVGTANKAMADMVRYAAEFGLTPSARARVDGRSPEPGPSELDEFLA